MSDRWLRLASISAGPPPQPRASARDRDPGRARRESYDAGRNASAACDVDAAHVTRCRGDGRPIRLLTVYHFTFRA